VNQIVSHIQATEPQADFDIPVAAGPLNTPTNALLGVAFKEATQALVAMANDELLPVSSNPNTPVGHDNRLAIVLDDDQASAVAEIARRWHRKMASIVEQAPEDEKKHAAEYQLALVSEWQKAITKRSFFIGHIEMFGRPYKLYSPRVDLADPATWVPAYVQFSPALYRNYADHEYHWAAMGQ
jgi:predicted transcriptional regulator